MLPRTIIASWVLAGLSLGIAGCGGTDGSAIDGAAARGDAPPETGAAPTPAEPTNRGWIGGACASTSDCPYDGGLCLASADGFPGGLCTRRCDSTCPDRFGPDDTETFCVADRAAEGTCVSRCDFAKLPGVGCRKGYGCTRASRMGDPDRVEEVCVPLGGDGRAAPLNELQPALERAVKAADLEEERVVLLDVTPLRVPAMASIHGTSPMYPASVIKVVVMAEVERQIERGMLSRTQTLTITDEEATCDSLPSGDTRPLLDAGDAASVDALVEVMITRSDNTATNALIDKVGRQSATAFMQDLGLPTLQVHKKVFGCTPYTDSGWDGAHTNTMTALETAKLYRLILEGGDPRFVGADARRRMLDVLADQRWRGGIAATLPSDAQYLSKTGDTSDVVHDTGIIILWQGRRFIVAAFAELPPSVGRPRLRTLGAELTKILAAR